MALLRGVNHCMRLPSMRGPLLWNPYQIRSVVLKPSTAGTTEDLSHYERNKKLNRPLSPHLSIYKFQLTSMMSISHRITGLMLTAYSVGLAGSSFMATDIPHMVAQIQAMGIPAPIIFLGKFILAFPVSYHLFNGVRHLIWDMGKALTMKEVYATGYVTLGLTLLFALYLAKL